MKIKSIVLAFLCIFLLVGCNGNSSSEKETTSKTTTTTTQKNLSFEATATLVDDDGRVLMIKSDYEIDSANGKIG